MSQAARRHPPRGSIDRMLALTQLQRPRPRSAYVRLTSTPVRCRAAKSQISSTRCARSLALRRWLPRGLDPLYGLAVVVFRRVSWLLFGARQHPSFLDSDPIRLTASAPLFTLS